MSNSNLTTLIVFLVLVFATLTSRVLSLFIESPELDRVWLRIKAWWFIALIPLGCLHLGVLATEALFAFVSVMATLEFSKMTGATLSLMRGIIYSLPPFLISSALAFRFEHSAVFWAIDLACLLLAWTSMVWWKSKSGAVIFISFSLSLVAACGAYGPIFFLLFVTSLNDVFQYLSGKCFGRTQLAPRLSPSKTWEGLLGGLIATGLIGACLGPYSFSVSKSSAFMLSVGLAIAGTLGDLTISAFKRRAQVKDTGTLLPGHGGILDRVDSLLMTGPLFYFFMNWKGIL